MYTKTEMPVIGVYCLCNTGGLSVHKIDCLEEKVLVSCNDGPAEWLDIVAEFDQDENEYRNGFKWGEMFIPFDQVMRV